MDDLIAFLRGRLDEREDGLRKLAEKTATDSYSALEMSLHAEISILASAQPRPQSVPAAEQAAWQHMLAEVDAKRQIIDAYERAVEEADPALAWTSPEYAVVAYENVLKLLALPFAGHPSYREEEWRP
jgi:hypothetical protein